ncbi:hypothetical protein ACTFIZ_012373 [Dictyostelium cf. discoideum]
MTTHSSITHHTKQWLEKAVIGLNLCPFAKEVYNKQQIKYHICSAKNERLILQALQQEFNFLVNTPATTIDTTLFILEHALIDFYDFNDFLALADQLLEQLNIVGVLQIASFHPHYHFANTQPDDIENYTNRAPYPILHILREQSIDQVVVAIADAATIFEKNIATMQALGVNGWKDLMQEK